jgi:hypothetical protein
VTQNLNYKKALSLIFKLLSVVCIGFIIYKIKEVGLKIDFNFETIAKISIVTILYTLGLHLLGVSWQLICEKSIYPLNDQTYRNSYLKTLIGKYLPGNVFHLIGRNTILVQKKVPPKKILTAFFMDNILYGLSSILLFLIFSFFITPFNFSGLQIHFSYLVPALIITIGAIIFFSRKYFFILPFLGYFSFFILCGLCFNLFSSNTDLNIVFKILSIYPLSWLAGYLAIGSPGGIGIREFLLIMILGPYLGEEIIISSAIQFRLCNILAEVILFTFFKDKND